MNEFARVGFNYGSFYYAYILKWQLLSQNQVSGTSSIRIQSSIYVEGANNINWTRGSASLNNVSFSLSNSYPRGETIVNSQDITVQHDSNGNASVYISGSIDTTFIMNGSCGGTINLPWIDRNSPSLSLVTTSVSENSAVLSYSTNSSLDSLQGRLNNGSWQNLPLSNPITITGLTDDSNYTYQVRGKKASNQIWGASNTISFKTKAGTFAMVSVNGSALVDAEVYVVTEEMVEKISKDQYTILVGDDG